MMARKLSIIAPSIVAYSFAAILTIAVSFVRAEGEVQVTAPKSVVDNPYVATQPKPHTVAEEPQAAPRGPTTYQNPFANMSKAPPIDKSLRPGPISRWQHPLIPASEPSAVKAAVLSEPSTQPIQAANPVQTGWNQLPGDENTRQRAATAAPENSASLEHLADPEPIIRSIPTSVVQPDSIASASSDPSPLDFQPPLLPADATAHAAHASQGADAPIAGPSIAPANKINAAFSTDQPDHGCELASHVEQLSTFVSDSDNTPEGWLKQAQDAATAAETSEELTTVISLCDRGLQGTPTAELLSSLRRLSAWAHNRRGEMFADAQRSDDAIQDFQVAISMDPNCSLAIHNRGVTFAQRNQFAAALRDFNRVIELNPGLAVAYRNRAELLAALGRMEEAVADYNQAISSLPEDPSLLCARAHAYQRVGDFSYATADVNRAIKLAPHDPELITQRGSLAAEQGKFEEARNDFRDAIAADATRADAYRSLAWLQATCSDPRYRDAQQALAHAEKAAKLSPEDDYLILDTLAAANACSGNFNNAIDLEEKALAAAPRDLSTPLEERLALYQRNKAFTSSPARNQVRTVSHEVPARNAKAQPSPVPR
jgi:tetratricopeptide (TPR) repeat protein